MLVSSDWRTVLLRSSKKKITSDKKWSRRIALSCLGIHLGEALVRDLEGVG